MRIFPVLVLFVLLAACQSPEPESGSAPTVEPSELQKILRNAKRIVSQEGWFEILKLPNDVYALWEPGHVEKVNSFLIIGRDRDLLYDTGMGIASVHHALADIRAAENLPEKPLIVINSHNHLDHNGGNREFNEVFTADVDWARRRLTLRVPAADFVAYWDQLTNHPGTKTPANFDPAKHVIPPYPLEQVRYLNEGDVVELGNRRFSVIRTYSHSPDGIALYDREAELFFGGDTFYGPDYLITDLSLLAKDLQRVAPLPVRWHYASHGLQLIAAMKHGEHLVAVERMLHGEGESESQVFAGVTLPVQRLDGVKVTVAPELLLY